MSKTKIKIPNDVKLTVLSYIKGYDRRVKIYKQKCDEIINSSSCDFSVAYNPNSKSDDKSVHVYTGHSSTPSTPTENKAMQIVQLEQLLDVRIMRAIEQAYNTIGNDVYSDESIEKLKTAIWKNCVSGKKHPYEYLNVDEFSRRDFYRRKDKFLYLIAERLNLL